MHAIAIAGLATWLVTGCYVEPDEDYITVESIQVDEVEGNLTPNLEVEVHIYDFVTDTMLGCAELPNVEQRGVRYQVNARFQVTSPARTESLRLVDLDGRDIYLWVVERDNGSCPLAFDNAEDDIIGRSFPFAAEDLATPRAMEFEDVQFIRVGAMSSRGGSW